MNRNTLEKRALKRTKMVLGLKLAHPQLNTRNMVVHSLDISSSGARVGALREAIEPGTVLDVHYRHRRARCTVVWSRTLAPGETQIGIELLDQARQLWEVELEDNCAGIWLSIAER